MRSLSLESITANKNMKLLSLLVTLFALSYANSDITARTFSELLHRLEKLHQHQFNEFNKSVYIQTPRDIKNACECKGLFAKHLKEFLKSYKSVVPRSQFANILDNLGHFNLSQGVKPNDNCNFAPHHLKTLKSDEFKNFTQDNIAFIQNWNAHCRPNHQ